MARILVVDDDLVTRRTTARYARAAGHEVVEVASGADALAAVAAAPFDLVLLDIVMPGLDGFETCRQLRAAPHGDDLAIVFVTGADEVTLADDAIAAGADDLLAKPVIRAELVVRVRALLRTYASLRAERAARAQADEEHRRVEEISRQKDELNRFLVHDLKNPLAGIAVTLHSLLAVPLGAELREALAACLAATETIDRMLLDVLDVTSGVKLEPHRFPFELEPVLARLRTETASRLAARELTLDARTTVGLVHADPDLLRRMLANLVDNALRYTPLRSTITVTIDADGTDAVLRVTDQGPGIPVAHRERIFDRFVRLDPANDARAGRGLGLAFCRTAAAAHGGTITVEDNAPRGAAFVVRLPGAVVR